MPLRSEPAPPMLMPSSSQRTHVRGYSPSATFHALPPAMAALSVGRNVSSPAAPQLNHSGRIVTTAVATPSLSAAVTGAGVKWRQVAFAIVLSRGGWSDDVNADAGFCVPVRSRTLLVGRGAAKLHAGQIVPANVLSIAEQQNARPPVHVENQGHHFRFPRKQVNPALRLRPLPGLALAALITANCPAGEDLHSLSQQRSSPRKRNGRRTGG
ncbi:unnamed protein product [Tilletia laevis]|uniref:Uncharacterized protein n=2 Tax=Tilletia TaxID=13289 RepID=A0A177V6N0_9BASI|nr:hypothetical protein CF336_g5468 [Tilletia laevis]KAE8191484.1 hypothetical protein CF328_g5668 [Tilletia controversa]KAE8247635.1 hypothetical protein A4X03_0g6995 [Tilletia caries]KAE8197030.1 hypothetical protein CF335_g4712 [Tilletia laevis]CAD6892979.1 unnamed protein product [Tilletia caries]